MAIELDELAGSEGGDKSSRLAKHWLDQISSVNDDSDVKNWISRGNSIVKRYRDERHRVGTEDAQRRYNALWSNVEILKPALYGKMPLPVAERRFKDKDPSGRGAAQILERALRNEIEICGFDEAIQAALSDYLLPGRGTVWVRYEPEIEESASLPIEPETDMRDNQGSIIDEGGGDHPSDKVTPGGRVRPTLDNPESAESAPQQTAPTPLEEEKLRSTNDRIIRESTPVDFIPWPDFFTFPARARTWNEVTGVAKRVYMSRQQMIRRFGKKIGKAIPLHRDERGTKHQNTSMQAADQDKGEVFEVWSKDDMGVYWVAQGYDWLLDYKDDPLRLENFFPCPRPLYANPTTNTLIPVPDYIEYQDQAVQIDELTHRIAMLTKACKVAGLYNAAAKDVQRLFLESVENELIPVDDWAAFAKDGGGVEGNMSLLPVQDMIQVINELMIAKAKQVEEMDRLTGINDIMRGTTDARETLGAQRLKTNNTGTRLTRRQNEVARFARDVIRIMADIMCQHFSPQSLIEVSGALYEEGLGPDDMPSPGSLQPNGGGIPPVSTLPPPGPQPAGAQPPSQTQPQPAPSPMTGPQGVPGTNVVPFRPPGMPAPQVPLGPQPVPSAPPMGGLPGMGQPPIPPQLQAQLAAVQRIAKAISLLRNEKLRGFRVDIEVDSTIYADAAQDKADRNDFIMSVTKFLETSMQVGAQLPEAVPLLGKLLQFGARGHKIGRDLELSIEEFADVGVEVAKQRMLQQQNKPDPEAMKAQVELEKAKTQQQTMQIRAQADTVRAQAEIQSTQIQAQADQRGAEAEVQRQEIENQGERENSQADLMSKNIDLEMQKLELETELKKSKLEIKKMELQVQAAKARPASGSK